MAVLFNRWSNITQASSFKTMPLRVKTRARVVVNCMMDRLEHKPWGASKAFFRWAVRSRPTFIRSFMKGLLLHSRAKKPVALYRLMDCFLTRKKKLTPAKTMGMYVISAYLKRRLGILYRQWGGAVDSRFKAWSRLECMITIL